MAGRVVCAGLVLMSVGAATAEGQSTILLEQRQREIVMVRHLREHVVHPGDGLALAADRRDLQRLRSTVRPAPAAPLSGAASDDELVDSVGALVDVWHARLIGRQPFGLMPRERLAALQRVEQAVALLQARRRKSLETWVPDVLTELNALLSASNGRGELQDASIDLALGVADEAGVGGDAACQTLRASAGVSQSAAEMARAAECWTRTTTWPGWGALALESLDWAVSLSAAERNCQTLRASLDTVRDMGPRLGRALTPRVTVLVERGERERRRLHGQSLCR